MVELRNFDLYIDEQKVLSNININFGKEAYLLSGRLYKRKSMLLNTIANSFKSYTPRIKFSFETDISYLPNSKFLFEALDVKDNIYFYSKLFDVSDDHVQEIIQLFGLETYLKRKIYSLPNDLRQLVRIACVLVNNNASVLLLDNLFENLNKSQISIVKSYIKDKKSKCTLIFSKLNNHEIEEFNPRILTIEDKNLIFER